MDILVYTMQSHMCINILAYTVQSHICIDVLVYTMQSHMYMDILVYTMQSHMCIDILAMQSHMYMDILVSILVLLHGTGRYALLWVVTVIREFLILQWAINTYEKASIHRISGWDKLQQFLHIQYLWVSCQERTVIKQDGHK